MKKEISMKVDGGIKLICGLGQGDGHTPNTALIESRLVWYLALS